MPKNKPNPRAAYFISQAGGLLALLLPAVGYGQQSLLVTQSLQLSSTRLAVDEPAQAFAKYLALIQKRDPFIESREIGVEVEASLPRLAESGRMVAVRRPGIVAGSQYRIVRFEGSSTIKQQVIARYLDAEEQAAKLPYSSVAVTPANYRFRYVASIKTGGSAAYIFHISPKKKRAGLIEGQIWIDFATGVAVRQTGRLVKRPSIFVRQIEFTRDTGLRDGLAYARITHVVVDTRFVGRVELIVTERPLTTEDGEAEMQFAAEGQSCP